MIEVHLTKRETAWDVSATILPQGGLGIAKDAKLASIRMPTFAEASQAVADLRSADFTQNPDRWPVSGPKFQIVNQGAHPDPKNFGNYKILRDGATIGTIESFPRGRAIDLIKEALKRVADADSKSQDETRAAVQRPGRRPGAESKA